MNPLFLKKIRNHHVGSIKSVNSYSSTPTGKEIDDHNIQIENKNESPGDQTSVEPNTNPTENTQQNSLKIAESSYFETLNEPVQNPSSEMQQMFLRSFLHGANWSWKSLFKSATSKNNQSCDWNIMTTRSWLKTMELLDTKIQEDNITLEKVSNDTLNIK